MPEQEIGTLEHFDSWSDKEFPIANADDLEDALATYFATFGVVPEEYDPDLEG